MTFTDQCDFSIQSSGVPLLQCVRREHSELLCCIRVLLLFIFIVSESDVFFFEQCTNILCVLCAFPQDRNVEDGGADADESVCVQRTAATRAFGDVAASFFVRCVCGFPDMGGKCGVFLSHHTYCKVVPSVLQHGQILPKTRQG